MLLATLFSIGCNSQKKNDANKKKEEDLFKSPQGSWKVNKEFDEAGNLIRYDSIYSWSSDEDLDELATLDRDSTLKSMQSRFYRNFSHFDFDKEGFEDFYAEDSLFMKRFFDNDFFYSEFGRDFMDIDEMHQRMNAMQKRFLERYRPLLEPEIKQDSIK